MKYKFILVLLINPFFSYSQEGIGALGDNFLPVNQVKINPADMVDQRPWLSINLAGAHGYIRNNFAYLKDTRISYFKTDPTPVFDPPPGRFGKAFVAGEILGPSATLAYRKQAFGFHTSVRTYSNFNRIPAVIGQIIADDGVDNITDGTYEMNNGRVKTMSWTQVGISYGRILYERNDIRIDAGASINRLIGIHQASLTVRESEVEVINGKGTLKKLDGKYSYSKASFGSGGGWGTTVGVTYKKMNDYSDSYTPHSSSSGCKWLGYKYKIAFSLVDLGYIRFKENARTATLPDSATVDDVEDINVNILGVDESKFTGVLPTALSAQIDYNIKDNFYVNATVIQRVGLRNSFGVERSNMLSVNPRYETSLFTISLPLSMANYETPQVGLYFRVGPLAVGTDHLSSLIIKRDQRAASIYAYLNIPLKGPGCRESKPKNFEKWFCPVW